MLLGFDIGGTKCAVVLGEEARPGEISIIDKEILPTAGPARQMIASLFRAAEVIMKRSGARQDYIRGVGICCGGPLDSRKGLILSPPNLPGWDNIPIVEMVERQFGKMASLQNDANACAIAEWKYGAGKGYNDIIFLTFGTGMGAGLILNGRLYAGHNDCAGEVGHVRLSGNGPTGFGKAGSFEGFCSGGGIAQLARAKARDILQAGGSVAFCNSVDQLHLITAKSVAEAANNGDETAINIYATCGRYLGAGLSMLIDILNPQLIILGSIYGRAQSILEPWMREIIGQEALPGAYQTCRIVPAALGENIGDIAVLALANERRLVTAII